MVMVDFRATDIGHGRDYVDRYTLTVMVDFRDE